LGNGNTFLGYAAGNDNTTGDNNLFLGLYTGNSNTTGNGNIFLGYNAGYSNIAGNNNTFLGLYAGYGKIGGSGNTFLGHYAGYFNVAGENNIFLGYQAGYNETGSNKLCIESSYTASPLIYGEFDNDIVTINGKLGINTKTPGYSIEADATGSNACLVVNRTDGALNYINATNLHGNFGTVNNYPLRLVVNGSWRMRLNADNSLTLANGASLTAGGVWTDASSIVLKENIAVLSSDRAATTLRELNPVTYNYKADRNEKHVGFIAEEVPELVATQDRKSLSPMDIVAVLTKGFQDQQKLIQDQQIRLEKLEKEMAELKKKQ
jgi:hypothetical protein